MTEYGDRYCLIGPLSASAQIEFEEHQPVSYAMKHALDSLAKGGVKVCFLGSFFFLLLTTVG